MGFQDVIDEDFIQKGIGVIEDKEQISHLKDNAYSPIINALTKGPMTVKELTKNYNKIVKKRALKLDIPKAAFEKMKRTEKSIYRYVNDLISVGLVDLAGRRVVIDKTASENLYGRTAKVFLLKPEKEDYWLSEEAKVFLEKILRLMSIILDKPAPSLDCLSEMLTEMDRNRLREFYDTLGDKYEDISEILLEGSISENNKILDFVGVLLQIWNSKHYRSMLEKCFDT